MLAKYPEVVYFSGHTHLQLSCPNIYYEEINVFVGSSSVRNPFDQESVPLSGSISESLFIEVDDQQVRIRGRRHDLRRWADGVDFIRTAEQWRQG